MKFFNIIILLLIFCGQSIGQEANIGVLKDSLMIQFLTDQADIDDKFQDSLDVMLARWDTLNQVQFVIEAHTDDIGTDGYNFLLSERRALSLSNYLKERGIPDSIISVTFHGEKRELATNLTSKGRSINRRALLKILFVPPLAKPMIPKSKYVVQVVDLELNSGVSSDIVISGKDFREIVTTNDSGLVEISLPTNKVFKFQAFPFDKNFEPKVEMAKTSTGFESPLLIKVKQQHLSPKKNFVPNKLFGKVIDKESALGLPSYLIIQGSKFRDSISCDSDGRFSLDLPKNEIVEISAFSEGYFFVTKPIAPNHSYSEPLIFQLSKLKLGLQFTLNLHFISGTPRLLKSSIPKLHYLKKVVEASGDLCFKIDGHVNFPNAPPVGKSTFSWRLSWDRAREVKRFLIDQGIDKKRLMHEGFGNWHMVEPFAMNEADMQKNRRVEVRIIECQP